VTDVPSDACTAIERVPAVTSVVLNVLNATSKLPGSSAVAACEREQTQESSHPRSNHLENGSLASAVSQRLQAPNSTPSVHSDQLGTVAVRTPGRSPAGATNRTLKSTGTEGGSNDAELRRLSARDRRRDGATARDGRS
jgi:hypothetical protein